jgi:hypothetical protein
MGSLRKMKSVVKTFAPAIIRCLAANCKKNRPGNACPSLPTERGISGQEAWNKQIFTLTGQAACHFLVTEEMRNSVCFGNPLIPRQPLSSPTTIHHAKQKTIPLGADLGAGRLPFRV